MLCCSFLIDLHQHTHMVNIAALKTLLAEPKNIVITTHHKPDGDAMGSSLGLYNYLLQKGHHVHVITPTDYPIFLHWLPNNGEVLIYTDKVAESKQLVADADLIFCLDFNALSRINELGECVAASAAKKVMIDHHLDPEDFDDYRLWNVNACSAAQLVYEFIVDFMAEPELINKDVANCLYTGIMTDSGSFRFPNTTAAVHRIVSHLIENGAENARITTAIFNGEKGAPRDAVVLNAAAAIAAFDGKFELNLHDRIARGVSRAINAIDSGASTRLVAKWAELSQKLGA